MSSSSLLSQTAIVFQRSTLKSDRSPVLPMWCFVWIRPVGSPLFERYVVGLLNRDKQLGRVLQCAQPFQQRIPALEEVARSPSPRGRYAGFSIELETIRVWCYCTISVRSASAMRAWCTLRRLFTSHSDPNEFKIFV
jgi:hypothetical protein